MIETFVEDIIMGFVFGIIAVVVLPWFKGRVNPST